MSIFRSNLWTYQTTDKCPFLFKTSIAHKLYQENADAVDGSHSIGLIMFDKQLSLMDLKYASNFGMEFVPVMQDGDFFITIQAYTNRYFSEHYKNHHRSFVVNDSVKRKRNGGYSVQSTHNAQMEKEQCVSSGPHRIEESTLESRREGLFGYKFKGDDNC